MYLTTRFTTPVGTKPVNAPRVLCAGMLTFFFFNDTATTEIYTLSLHDALPILRAGVRVSADRCFEGEQVTITVNAEPEDRKSTRLNSSHVRISYAVFCLKK